ncbi:MAG: hypothetical protein H6701_14640 [Myxococcales bacterium]|nr:hypothetical protein [Myxococcales bacterium]
MNTRAPVILFVAVLLGACSTEDTVKPDAASGDDAERGHAQELFLDKLTDDFLDAEGGDATDWKFFKIRDKGILTLTVYWDNKDVRSIIDVRDRFGALLDSRRHSSELEKDKLELRVEPGTHFVRLFTEKGESVYTIEAVFQRFDHTPSDDVRPVATSGDLLGDPLGGDPRPRAKPRGRRGGGTPRPRPQPTNDGAGEMTSARIVRLLPSASGRGTIITIDKGTENGVTVGSTGHIVDDDGSALKGGTLRVIDAREKTSRAETELSRNNIAHRRRVRVRVQ